VSLATDQQVIADRDRGSDQSFTHVVFSFNVEAVFQACY
jgi:hypothetical protein